MGVFMKERRNKGRDMEEEGSLMKMEHIMKDNGMKTKYMGEVFSISLL
jgi:hypothetical protein